jgi:hypothetical protein
MNSAQARSAARACQKLLPNGGTATEAQQAQEQQAILKFAQCMRAHGVSKFPGPNSHGELVISPKVGVDPNSPQFKTADQSCRKVAPGGPIAPPPAAP